MESLNLLGLKDSYHDYVSLSVFNSQAGWISGQWKAHLSAAKWSDQHVRHNHQKYRLRGHLHPWSSHQNPVRKRRRHQHHQSGPVVCVPCLHKPSCIHHGLIRLLRDWKSALEGWPLPPLAPREGNIRWKETWAWDESPFGGRSKRSVYLRIKRYFRSWDIDILPPR